jgi:hypothetical protein
MYGSGVIKINVVLSPLSGDASFVRWVTIAGSLGDFNLNDPVDLPLTALSSDASGISYALSAGSLPSGLALDAPSGRIAGIAPASLQLDTFDVRATNGSGQFSDQTLSLNFINQAPVWQTPAGSIGAAKGGDPFEASLLATDPNDWTVHYSLTNGTLPVGLALSASTGRLAGTLPILPDATDFAFTITASDGRYSTARSFTITVDFVETLAWTSASGSLGSDVQGQFFYARVSAVSYATNAVVRYAVSAGSLPNGLAIDAATGSISGKLPAVASDTLTAFTLTASDGHVSLPSQCITTLVDNNGVDRFANSVVMLLHMNETDNANATTQQVFVDLMQHTLTPEHANDPVNSRDTHLFGNAAARFNNAALSVSGPDGADVALFDLSSTDFTLEFAALPFSGAPVAFLSLGDDLAGHGLSLYHDGAGSLALDYHSTIGTPLTARFPWTLPYGVWSQIALVRNGTVLRAFADGTLLGSVSVSGGIAVATPLVLHLGVNRYGTPGRSNYHGLLDAVRLTRAARYTADYPLPTRPWPNLPVWSLPATLADAVETTPYSATVLATQPDANGLTYTATGLPTGLVLNPILGVIGGIAPPAASDTTYHPLFSVTDGFNTVAQSASLTDRHHIPPTWITPGGNLGHFVEGSSVHLTLAASSAQFLPLNYVILSGQLPPGLSLGGGAISGIAPAESTNASFTVTLGVSDAIATVARDFSLSIEHNLPPVWSSSGTILTEVHGQPVNLALQATDPLGQTLTFTVVGGTLPAGLSLSADGLISGTLIRINSDTTVGFTVQARNPGGLAATQALSIVVLAGVLPSWLTSAGHPRQLSRP